MTEEQVARAELSHAYGSAADVPDLLRRMAGTDETDVITAQHELRASILHQGSVCTATTPAVPFLGALLADPACGRSRAAGRRGAPRTGNRDRSLVADR